MLFPCQDEFHWKDEGRKLTQMALRSVKTREVFQEKVAQTSKVMFVLRRETKTSNMKFTSSKPLENCYIGDFGDGFSLFRWTIRFHCLSRHKLGCADRDHFPDPKFSKQFGSQLSGEDGEHLLDVLLEVSKW